MQEASASFLPENDDDFIGEKSNLEHCAFSWTIKDFLEESGRHSEFIFQASKKDESFTLWQLDLNEQNDDIKINLTRLKSPNQALVFVRFRWEILDRNGNKVLPGSIHALANPNDIQSKKFVEIDKLLEDLPRFLPNGHLSVFCELTAYERKVEERISSLVKGNISHALNALTDDLEKLLLKGSGADMQISSMDGAMRCHKSILSVRSSAFAELIEAVQSDDCHLHLGDLKGDELVAILTHLYLGNLDMYLEHTIPRDLYSIATEYGLQHLQQHLDLVNSNGLTMLKSLDVRWKLPYFKHLMRQPRVTLYCPEQNTRTLYDKRWCFRLEFDSSSNNVDISVVRRQEENSVHYVKFLVQIEQYGETTFQQVTFLLFEADGAQEMEDFLTKGELSGHLSYEDTLVLKCSLEVLRCKHTSSRTQESSLRTLVEHISNLTEMSLLKIAEDLRRMYAREIFSDAVVDTRVGRISYHSFLASARFELPEGEFKTFVESLDPHLVKAFFLFLYGGDAVRYKAIGIKQAAELRLVPSIVEKMKKFLVSYQA